MFNESLGLDQTTFLNQGGQPEHSVYFGRQYIKDYKTKLICAGPMKIGRTSSKGTLFRGRNQAGGDFRFLAEIIFETKREAVVIEKYFHSTYISKNIQYLEEWKEYAHRQTECFLIENEEIYDMIEDLKEVIFHCNLINPLDYIIYDDDYDFSTYGDEAFIRRMEFLAL